MDMIQMEPDEVPKMVKTVFSALRNMHSMMESLGDRSVQSDSDKIEDFQFGDKDVGSEDTATGKDEDIPVTDTAGALATEASQAAASSGLPASPGTLAISADAAIPSTEASSGLPASPITEASAGIAEPDTEASETDEGSASESPVDETSPAVSETEAPEEEATATTLAAEEA